MPSLRRDLRSQLEKTVLKAREVAEQGAHEALTTLGINQAKPFDHQKLEQKKLRNQLRARGRQVGDKGVVPILYLPSVARHQLRAADQCPWELQLLVELLYRGAIWTHPNGRDWSLEAFFQSPEGLGLDMATDEKTRESLRRLGET